METNSKIENDKLLTIKQLIDIDKPEIWQKIQSMLKAELWGKQIEQKLQKKIEPIPEKTDIVAILKEYKKPDLSKIIGILDEDELIDD